MTRSEIARLAFVALALLPVTPSAAAAQDATACATPGKSLKPIKSTRTIIPYPPISVRLNEQGVTMTTVAIGSDGVPTDVTVTRSSGSDRLDAAVVGHIKDHDRWEPPTEDCKPTTAQARVNVAWHIGYPPKPKAGLEMPPSSYPPGAAERGESGNTYLQLTLGDGGVVMDGHVVYSSGFPDLDEKALEVVKAKPVDLSDQPAGTEVLLIRWPPARDVEVMTITIQRIQQVE